MPESKRLTELARAALDIAEESLVFLWVLHEDEIDINERLFAHPSATASTRLYAAVQTRSNRRSCAEAQRLVLGIRLARVRLNRGDLCPAAHVLRAFIAAAHRPGRHSDQSMMHAFAAVASELEESL